VSKGNNKFRWLRSINSDNILQGTKRTEDVRSLYLQDVVLLGRVRKCLETRL
jgi:hypothetical protein